MRSPIALAAVLLLVATIPSPAAAQTSAARATTLPQPWQPHLPQSLHSSPSGTLAEVPVPLAAIAAPAIGRGGRKEAVALMIVGGAGLVTGLLVDESLITIAGAGVAGVGLYLYLR